VPCTRSSRRVVVRAASSSSDHSSSGLVRPPHLIGSQAKITQDPPERLPPIDGIQEHLAHLGRESLLRLASEAFPRCVLLRLTASVAVAPFQPAGQRAVCRLRARSAVVPEREPPPDDRRRHIARGSRLANR
jgi:hypothetical protein